MHARQNKNSDAVRRATLNPIADWYQVQILQFLPLAHLILRPRHISVAGPSKRKFVVDLVRVGEVVVEAFPLAEFSDRHRK